MTIESRRIPGNRRRRVGRWPFGLLLIPWLLLGAGPPGEIRIRVPSAKVGTWFPAGTELRGMQAGQFDALMRSARSGYRRAAGPPDARLLGARHLARWEAGRLVGRSELVAETADGGPAELTLTPWTPAIDPTVAAEETAPPLRMHDDGRTAIRLASPTPTAVTLDWQLQARPNSQGRSFHLGLPATATSALTLDLPEGFVPEGPEGIVIGPAPGSAPGRKTWRFEGRGGLVELHLRSRAEGDGALREPGIWVSGPTRIELGEASANWTTEWSVSLDPRGPRRFVVELDEGLEFIEATGPAVEAAYAEPAGGRTRVTVRLDESAAPATTVTFRAVTQVPPEGPWTVPAVRALDAQWTGGRTTIRLDPSRIVKDCQERSGRRVSSRPAESADANQVVLEAVAPGPVAVLTFGRPRADFSVEVRGQLLLGNAAPRLESQLTWRVHRGRLLALDVDLPPAWVPERVSVMGVDEPLAWNPSTLPGGGVRIHATTPSGDFARNSLTLNIVATAAIAGGRGSIMLPRVRPVGGQVVDERWLAWTESGVTLHAETARGLAWIDPSLVIGSAPQRPEALDGLREALAWRWIAEQAEARVERDRAPSEPSGSIELLATVDRERLRLDWKISVDPGEEPLRSIPMGMSEPVERSNGGDWRFTDEATSLELRRRPLDEAKRAALGLSSMSEAWELAVPDSGTGPVVIRSRLEVPWSGRGRLPLLVLPERFRSRNFVVIDVARNLRARVDSAGLRALDPKVVGGSVRISERAEDSQGEPRRDYAFGYMRPGGHLALRTEALEPARSEGVIDQALLTTIVDPQGPRRHRLTLRVAVTEARSFDLAPPRGATLLRVRRDGQAIAPGRTGRGLSLPLTSPSSARLFSTFVLDYLTPLGANDDDKTIQPERPQVSLPILALRWEVIAPEPWGIAEHGAALIASDPAPSSGRLRRIVNPWRAAWQPASRASTRREVEMLRWLDSRVADISTGEMTLGEWLTRWDVGPWPLVVDRMALETAGCGPRSRVASPRADASRPGAARAALQSLGLTLVPLGDSVLVTTRGESRDGPGGSPGDRETLAVWEARLREASLWGSDASDRFQSVARWRGELTPKTQFSGDTTDFEPVSEGWRVWRFTASGWPETGAAIHLVDERRAAAWGWVAGLAVFALGIACRGFSARSRAFGLAVGLLIVFAAVGQVPAADMTIAAGALIGQIAVLFFWAGRSLPRGSRAGGERELRTASSLRLRPGGSGVMSALLAALACTGVVTLAQNGDARPDPAAPIVALFPYEGSADPTRAPDRAVIRLDDYERLKRLAELPDKPPSLALAALAATHSVSRIGELEAVIESEIALLAECPGPATWTFPIGNSRDITAELDGTPAPILVQPGAQAASVSVAGRGRARLRIRRVASLRRNADGESLSLPINPLASARVEVDAGSKSRRVEVLTARGGIEARGPGVVGTLGPADRLEVRWDAMGRPATRSTVAGTVDGLLLWDAEPAGDRVRARFTYRNPEGTAVVRLRLEPGLIVRSSTIPGLLDATNQATPRGPEWVANVDPPLPDGTAIRLEFWRPHPVGPDGREPSERPLPRIEPLDVESYKGAIGFRRPADWAGRLPAGAGGEPITEEMFVRTWGNLPDEPLTLSGATRFSHATALAVRTGPQVARLSVQPSVSLILGPGRIEVTVDAKLVQESGRSYQLDVLLPPALSVTRVEAEGLTDWSRVPDRLVLRFDGAPSKQRSVRIQGWLPVADDPLATASAPQEIAVPWPRWIDADAIAGTLDIEAPTSFRLESSAGVLPLPVTPEPVPLRTAPIRRSYRVDRAEGLGPLRWEREPPRVDVQVRSQLMIHPDSAEWVATLRYNVSGGACDTLLLKMPTSWASTAEVTLVGEGHELTTETRGPSTALTIRPRHPIWGVQSVIVRSSRPLSGTGALLFPDLVPTVHGAVETYLALVNASSREIVPEGSPGLQPVVDASLFQAEEFWPLSGLPTKVYRVRSDGWSLKVETPGESLPAGASGQGQVRATLAAIECILRADGSALGSLRCQVETRSAPFLPLDLPAGSVPLWVSVNDAPVRALRTASGPWLIPVDARGTSEVILIWKSERVDLSKSSVRPVPLPVLDQPGVPLFVSVRAPRSLSVTSRNRVLQPSSPDWQDLASAEWLGRSIAEKITTIDRSSLRDREALVSSLVNFELALRSAERAAVRVPGPSLVAPGDRLEHIRQRIRSARAKISESLESVGLDDLAKSARVHLGLAREEAGRPIVEIPEPTVPVRVRRLGIPRRFQGESATSGLLPSLTWSPAPAETLADREEVWTLVLSAIVVASLAWGLVRRSERLGRLGTAVLVVALAMTALGGPWLFVTALAASAIGWRSAP